MILEFSVTNFLSFKDKVTLSMLANQTSGLNDNYIICNDRKILKTVAIYGANASGKSNLFKVLTNVIIMLSNSNNFRPDVKLPIIPFMFDKRMQDKPSEFEIKFITKNVRYVYGFIADKNKIYEEYLYYYPNGREAKIFDRTSTSNYSFPQKDESTLKDIAKRNSENKFFLATATNWNYEKTKDAYEFLTKGIGTCFNLEDLKNISFKFYEENANDLKIFALDFLKKADLSIEDYKISKINIPKEAMINIPEVLKESMPKDLFAYKVEFKHNKSENYLLFDEESMGTQILFCFIPFMMEALQNNKVLIIDELDRSMHPFVVEMIVQMFNDKDINKNGAQLIFNTHDTNLLDLNILRRDQIWFTEKNSEDGSSDLYSLSDFSVRKDENFGRNYLLGRYGAVPFIKNNFNLWEKE